jgi:hypothetical protein
VNGEEEQQPDGKYDAMQNVEAKQIFSPTSGASFAMFVPTDTPQNAS